MIQYLDKEFFARRPEDVAQDLIGARLVVQIENQPKRVARITETEAYLAMGDAAAHHARYGPTPARAALYKEAGALYIHAMRAYVGMDIVTEGVGVPSSVLIRAAEPLEGFLPADFKPGLLQGPGKLCKVLRIDRSVYGLNVCDAHCPIRVLPREGQVKIGTGPRIGLTRSTDA